MKSEPAFPQNKESVRYDQNLSGQNLSGIKIVDYFSGVTILDYFAAKATELDIQHWIGTAYQKHPKLISREEARFLFAEAMVAEKKRREAQ